MFKYAPGGENKEFGTLKELFADILSEGDKDSVEVSDNLLEELKVEVSDNLLEALVPTGMEG